MAALLSRGVVAAPGRLFFLRPLRVFFPILVCWDSPRAPLPFTVCQLIVVFFFFFSSSSLSFSSLID